MLCELCRFQHNGEFPRCHWDHGKGFAPLTKLWSDDSFVRRTYRAWFLAKGNLCPKVLDGTEDSKPRARNHTRGCPKRIIDWLKSIGANPDRIPNTEDNKKVRCWHPDVIDMLVERVGLDPHYGHIDSKCKKALLSVLRAIERCGRT